MIIWIERMLLRTYSTDKRWVTELPVGGHLNCRDIGCSQTRFKALICVFLTSPESHYSEQKWLIYIEIFIKAWIDDTLGNYPRLRTLMASPTATMNTCPRVIGFGLAKTTMTATINGTCMQALLQLLIVMGVVSLSSFSVSSSFVLRPVL